MPQPLAFSSKHTLMNYKKNDIFYWIALNNIHGIGCNTYKNLIQHFGTPKEVFDAPVKEFKNIDGLNSSLIKAIKAFDKVETVEKEVDRVKRSDVDVITLNNKQYPCRLKEIYDPPPYLYVKGRLTLNAKVAVAVVGSRASTPYGLGIAQKISMELASCGVVIVSGMARGIDSHAHRGALKGRGETIAVLGSGIDVVYPPENDRLCKEIAKTGAVVSEFPFSTPPLTGNFPRRNRIISGLSLGVLVIEASLRSGSLITARLALEQGRDVFAIPGSVTSLRSQGTNKLIKSGAKLVEKVEDVLEEILDYRRKDPIEKNLNMSSVSLEKDEEDIYKSLERPKHIDEIISEKNLDPSAVSALLLALEMKGLVRQHPGKFFAKKET